MAKEEDFVAFKLDIDTPEIEVPIVLKLIRDPQMTKLIDEFFFELHFHSEVECGWSKAVPAVLDGLVLDRTGALQLFRTLREDGIRAHVWT